MSIFVRIEQVNIGIWHQLLREHSFQVTQERVLHWPFLYLGKPWEFNNIKQTPTLG